MKAMTSSMFINVHRLHSPLCEVFSKHLISLETTILRIPDLRAPVPHSSRHWSPSDWRSSIVLKQNESSMKHALLSRVWTSSKIWFANELHLFWQENGLVAPWFNIIICRTILDHYFHVNRDGDIEIWRYIFHQKMKYLQKRVQCTFGIQWIYNMQVTFSTSWPSRHCAAVRRVEYHSSPLSATMSMKVQYCSGKSHVHVRGIGCIVN